MEPLFVVIDFGRGFDSRRLHHNLLIITNYLNFYRSRKPSPSFRNQQLASPVVPLPPEWDLTKELDLIVEFLSRGN